MYSAIGCLFGVKAAVWFDLLRFLQVLFFLLPQSSDSLLPTFRSGSQRYHYRSLLSARAHTVNRTWKKICPLLYLYILLTFCLLTTWNIILFHGIVDGSICTAGLWRATGISNFPSCKGNSIGIQENWGRLEPWSRKPPWSPSSRLFATRENKGSTRRWLL